MYIFNNIYLNIMVYGPTMNTFKYFSNENIISSICCKQYV